MSRGQPRVSPGLPLVRRLERFGVLMPLNRLSAKDFGLGSSAHTFPSSEGGRLRQSSQYKNSPSGMAEVTVGLKRRLMQEPALMDFV